MENDLIWLRTSLFADKSQWGYVLTNGVKRFVDEVSNKNTIKSLLIEFNYLCGENIRVALKTEAKNARLLAHQIDDFFKGFFLSAKLYKKTATLPVTGVFMPFPKNTIQYGLYKVTIDNEQLNSNLTSKISDCIVNALEEEMIDEEILIMLAFYMHCSLITQLERTSKNIFLSHYNLDYQYKTGTVTESYLIEKYHQNKTSLIEVEKSIRNYDSAEYNENPRWLINWINDCKQIIYPQLSGATEVYRNFRNSINNQLGLTDNMTLLVYYFIKKVYDNRIIIN